MPDWTAPTNRRLALCADDFGFTPAVNQAVLSLAARGRLTEVSCMVNGAAWREGAAPLAALVARQPGALGLGLHFNLTEGRPLSPALAALWPRLPPLPRLMALAHARRLPLAALASELQAQLQAFEERLGAPEHLDGHQHIHHLPGVRQLVLQALASRPALRVRNTGHVRGPGHALKRWAIEASGGRALGRRLAAQGQGANTQLLGVHGFSGVGYRGRMQRWLALLPQQGGLVFCHPGTPPSPADLACDAIAAARVDEWAYLDSADFDADLLQAGVQLCSSNRGIGT